MTCARSIRYPDRRRQPQIKGSPSTIPMTSAPRTITSLLVGQFAEHTPPGQTRECHGGATNLDVTEQVINGEAGAGTVEKRRHLLAGRELGARDGELRVAARAQRHMGC